MHFIFDSVFLYSSCATDNIWPTYYIPKKDMGISVVELHCV